MPKLNVPATVTLDEPKLIVLELPLSELKLLHEMLYIPASNDPFVTVKFLPAEFPISKLELRVHPEPTPLTSNKPERAFPLVVNVRPVELPLSVIAPV